MNLEDFLVPPDRQIRLAEHNPNATGVYANEDEARAHTQAQTDHLTGYQAMFQAHAQYGMVILFQGMDAAGKDETIQEVLSALDPQVCHAKQFKSPTTTERQHDYLWRATQALPIRGEVAVFNRSYYEQVTTEQVYPELIDQWSLPPEARDNLWNKRYAQINNFERHLVENGFVVIKFFLHISKKTERERLLERIERPDMQWQFSDTDLRHHHDWDAFQKTYEMMLSKTSTTWAPWYIVPSNQRWATYAAVASILVDRFKALHTEYPALDDTTRQTLEHARAALQQEREGR
jgi:PPK2 family polyphosphate:nucleotide phosphotransferase